MEISELFAQYKTQIIATGVAVVIYFIIKVLIRNIIEKYGELTHKSKGRMLQMRHIIAVLLNIAMVFSLFIIWGVTKNVLVGLATAFAFLGVAMFAQWSVLSNITAGIVMFFSAPYRIGDKVRLLDKDMPIVAMIETIQAFYTHLRTEEGELVVLPNNVFLQKVVSIITEREE